MFNHAKKKKKWAQGVGIEFILFFMPKYGKHNSSKVNGEFWTAELHMHIIALAHRLCVFPAMYSWSHIIQCIILIVNWQYCKVWRWVLDVWLFLLHRSQLDTWEQFLNNVQLLFCLRCSSIFFGRSFSQNHQILQMLMLFLSILIAFFFFLISWK